jgi:hypothetical protein
VPAVAGAEASAFVRLSNWVRRSIERGEAPKRQRASLWGDRVRQRGERLEYSSLYGPAWTGVRGIWCGYG